MDWLNDKKNQPIIIGAFVLIIIVAGYVVWKTNFSGGGSSSNASQTAPPTAYPTPPPGAGGTGAPPGGGPPNAAPYPTPPPAAPAPTAAPPAAAPSANPSPQPPAGMVAKLMPMESYRSDPFLPIGYRPGPRPPKPIPHLDDLPIPDLERAHRDIGGGPHIVEYAAQPMRRMAGLLRSGRIYAILETNGKTEVVQPGDRLNDGMATVDRIESDKVVLKTTDKIPRYITVRMAGASRVDISAPAGTPGPGMPPGMPPGAYGTGGGMPRGLVSGP